MSNFHEQLDEEARRVHRGADALASVYHRAQRNRRTRRLASTAMAVVIGGGGLAIAFAAFQPSNTTRPVAGPTPSPTPTGERSGGVTILLASRSEATTFTSNPSALLAATAMLDGAGWHAGYISDATEIRAHASTELLVMPRVLQEAKSLRDRFFPGARIEVARYRQADDIIVWLGDDFVEANPDLLAAYETVWDFLSARHTGGGASEFLGDVAADQYRRREGGLSLYGYHQGVHEITALLRVNPRHPGPTRSALRGEFVAVVLFPQQGDTTVYETLRVGRTGGDGREPSSWLIVYAERNE